MKTILKLHSNGNLETVNTPLIQSGISDNYSFAENLITVPKIIEYPPNGVRNYFIEKTSVVGYVLSYLESGIQPGILHPANENDRTSDFINIEGWSSTTIRIRYKAMNNQFRAWASILFYTGTKTFLSRAFDDYVGPVTAIGDYTFEFKVPTNASFLRISTNYYDTPGVEVKISVERGNTTNPKHYLAPEDMPEWVKDTGQPISFFPKGVVVKGSLIQTNN